ncbi:MAG: hypothetical protein K0R29_2015 [Pseudobdellovibrio sp.]|nr:hypothetical protein [Pseudobdellovibrio sp.]
MNNGGKGGAVIPTYLDKSFGVAGKVDSDFSGSYEVVNDLLLQKDGKIIAVGTTGSPGNPKFNVVRYNADGSVDASFKVNQKNLEFSNGAVPYSAFLDSAERIVVAGASGGAMAALRLKKDGSLDETFGSDGKVTAAIGDRSSSFCVAAGSGDSVILGGFSLRGDKEEMALVKFDKQGNSLNEFRGPKGAGQGQFSFAVEGGNSRIYAIQSRKDSIVAVGTAHNGSNYDFAIVKLQPDGEREASFNGESPLIINHNQNGDDVLKSVVWLNDGKILVAGFTATTQGQHQVVIYRLKEDGTKDTSFGTDGHVKLPWNIALHGGAVLSGFVKISVDTLNRIYVATEPMTEGRTGFGVARLTPNGNLDSSYGNEGLIFTAWDITPNQNSSAAAHAIVLQPDGKALLGGYSYSKSNYNFALARYRNQ